MMKKKWLSHFIGIISLTVFIVLGLACTTAPPPPRPSPPPPPRNQVISNEFMELDWGGDPGSIPARYEIMDLLQSNLRRYRFFHVAYSTLETSATHFWNNGVRFRTLNNPHQVDVIMIFNYFRIRYSFSNTRLRVSAGHYYNESPFFTGQSLRVFTRDVNAVLSRASLTMRGMTFGDSRRYAFDRLWLDALRFAD